MYRPLRHPLSRFNDPPQPFQHFHNGRDLPHVGDARFFDGHAFAFGVWVAHGDVLGVGCVVRKSLNRRCSPSAIWINSTPKFLPCTQRTAAKMTSSEGTWNGRLRLNER